MDREREIVRASVYGIAGNLLLVAFKLAVGFVSHSIAIILDGVNNATDALSAIVTIVGTKLAGRRPDRRHPFGYGRVEYLTSVVIAVIILVAGVVSLRESVVKIIHPGTPSYSVVTIAVIFAGYQIAFAHKRISEVSPILIGGVLIGAAGQIARMLLGDEYGTCEGKTGMLIQQAVLYYSA